MLRPLQDVFDPRQHAELLVGLANPDDAAVYRLDAERALVVTNDFFTPVVDDAYDYGAIAAANSLSDVYAMGGVPVLALTIAALPLNLPGNMLADIMRGLGEKVREAGAVIAGGHTVQDKEPKLGLCVIGMAHPERLLTKGGARPGDVLILTKPLGTGILSTAAKRDQVEPRHLVVAVDWMKRLNRAASQTAVQLDVKAGTDVTGFGLLGHACEMAHSGSVGLKFHVEAIPLMDGVRDYARQRLFPGGAAANLKAYQQFIQFHPDVPETDRMLLLDPQTSGGLLLAVPRERAGTFQSRLEAQGETCWTIGEAFAGQGVIVQPSRS